MYTIEFYENSHGDADVWDFLENLRVKSATSKDAPPREIERAKRERDDYIRGKDAEEK